MAATSVPGGAAPASPTAPPDRRRWLILALIGLAQLMIVLGTAATAALTHIPGSLKCSDLRRCNLPVGKVTPGAVPPWLPVARSINDKTPLPQKTGGLGLRL